MFLMLGRGGSILASSSLRTLSKYIHVLEYTPSGQTATDLPIDDMVSFVKSFVYPTNQSSIMLGEPTYRLITTKSGTLSVAALSVAAIVSALISIGGYVIGGVPGAALSGFFTSIANIIVWENLSSISYTVKVYRAEDETYLYQKFVWTLYREDGSIIDTFTDKNKLHQR